jgi:hypothetical protein
MSRNEKDEPAVSVIWGSLELWSFDSFLQHIINIPEYEIKAFEILLTNLCMNSAS